MFELFETVKIKSNGVIGTIIDKTVTKGKAFYVVESDTYVNPSEKPYGGDWSLFNCVDEDLSAIDTRRAQMAHLHEAVAM